MWQQSKFAAALRAVGLICALAGATRTSLQAAPAPGHIGVPARTFDTVVKTFPSPGMVFSVALSPDGKLLAVGGHAGSVELWDVATAKKVRAWRMGGWSFVNTVVFSADGKTLGAAGGGGGDPPAMLWDVATGKDVATLGEPSESCNCLALARDGKRIALAGTRVQVVDLATGKQVWKSDGGAWCVAFSPDGRTLASLDFRNVITLWDAEKGKPLALLEGEGRNLAMYARLAFSPNGLRLATRNMDRSVDVWDLTTRKKLRRLPIPRGNVRHPGPESFSQSHVAFSPDSRTLISGEEGRTGAVLVVYDVATGQEVQQLRDQWKTGCSSAAFSKDGKLLVAGNNYGITLWGAREKSAPRNSR